jgi:hypothetical protein
MHEARRWAETRRRYQMLYGRWRDLLEERLQLMIGSVRKEAWGEPDMSSNVFRASVGALATLYDRGTLVTHDEQIDELTEALRLANLWPLMQRGQRDTIGMRELLHFVDGTRSASGEVRLTYRAVFPFLVVAVPDPDQPDRPIRISEMRLRRAHGGTARITWDVWDVSDPDQPSYRVVDASGGTEGRDLSDEYLGVKGGLVGAAYPERYRRADGTPVLPYVLRHAAVTGELWDAFELRELVEGSLNCAVHWTFFGHVLRNCSWPQRYAMGVTTPSAAVEGDDESSRRDAVVTDPATVQIFLPVEDVNQVLISQWQAGADPDTMEAAIALYERRVAAYGGISPADVQRVAGDPRSGFAIALNREAQREAQRRFEPVFRPADEEIVALSAIVYNRLAGTSLPEDGYRVAYQGLPASPEERQADREQIDWEIEHDQASPIDLYVRTHPGATEADAIDAIVKTRIDKALLDKRFAEEAALLGLGSQPKTPPTPTPQPQPGQPAPTE